MVAVGECGERNIGQSLVVDPLGVIVAQAGRDDDGKGHISGWHVPARLVDELR
ncbi:nitrilase/cyanide hydratase and apolipoprotein N-acyltransferase [Alcaligenes faecalis subsp. faecalis NCIB 8687]|nr:nitrilase/cyanide hydratase and apolipoprotein N-acyltransferase [Alcaligenes faecalis subsp. faecalis NCIB 8687]